ncbi:malectin domain-containing carbohydrate-binding protein [Zobellia uliginosa]|uniref:malectin domain-containing carbohydrate-binding protein n=1 Tax=Zobellia uliginosa TaxID=143224 RepID=UPI001C07BC3A|nr:malectin domain-containing carbohydrate-binding protein [Zobellia uliginosa]MBU2945676.1 PQQ-dependent sugar dehydrogenase [Zobellia uliginosa]
MKHNYATSLLIPCFIIFFLGNLRIQAQLPTEFVKTDLTTGLANATSFTFTPDGRVFILDRFGEILIYKPDTQITVSGGVLPVFHELEDGLVGIAVDPDFELNNKIYLHYAPLDFIGNRVSRFSVVGDAIDFSSEEIIIQWPTSRTAEFHSGGDMDFDSQGNLFIATGDNTTYGPRPYAPIDEEVSDMSAEKASSNTNDLRGKILRIKPGAGSSYTVPSGNLFATSAEGRPEIYVMGARNPYRIHVDEENDWLYWGEVGPDANVDNVLGPKGLDEINLTKAPGNYGWPYFSGADNDPSEEYAYQIDYADIPYYNDPAAPVNISKWNTGATNLPPAQEAWIEKFHKCYLAGFRYRYDSELLDDQRLPIEFDGLFFYYDFNTSQIWAVEMDANGDIITETQLTQTVFPGTGNSKNGYIDMEVGPDGKLYILAYGAGCCPDDVGTGRLIRVDYTGITTNSPPSVKMQANVTNGPLPLTVNFTGENTTDPNGDTPLTFAWDIDVDGTVDYTTENISHTYTVAGTYTAQLKVTDPDGAVGAKTITIYAGNSKANFDFASPPDGGLFGWNDDFVFDLNVNDPEEGDIDCTDVNVIPSLGHLNHFHDDNTIDACGTSLNLNDTGHDIDGEMDIYYVLNANYTDAGGLISRDQITLHPKRKEAEYYDTQSGTTIIENSYELEGASEALQVDNNGYISFSGRNLQNITGVKYLVASDNSGSTIELRVGSPTGNVIATTEVPSTGDNDEWIRVETPITAPSGKNDLFFVFKNNSSAQDIFRLNYVEFTGAGVSTDNTAPTVKAVQSVGNSAVSVLFSEYVDQASAENMANYAIGNGVTISSAVLQPDSRTVLLTTSSLSAGTSYSINISNVENTSSIIMVSDNLSFMVFEELRINAGGNEVVFEGNTFIADAYFNGGYTYSKAIDIEGTTNDAIYQSERYGPNSGGYGYDIPVGVSGEYDIRLHFAEIFFSVDENQLDKGAGTRVFNVVIEGEQVLTNFDILEETNPSTALVKEFNNVSITDGFASIYINGVEQSAKINAIEVLSPDTFEESTPTDSNITITSPSNGWDVNQPFEVAFRVENWTINEDDTHVHYFIDGTLIDKYYGYDPIPIDDLSDGEHTIKIELFNADHTGTGIYDEVVVNVTGLITCNVTPFPESWVVHEFAENPYVVVYTFADYDLDGDGLKDIVTGGWWYKNSGIASGEWAKNEIGSVFRNVAHVYDFDNDGDMDLLGTTGEYKGAQLVWAQNDGSGNFTVYQNIPEGNTDYVEPFLAGIAGGVFDNSATYRMAINWNGAESTDSPIQMLTPSNNITTEMWSLVDISSESSGEDIQAGDIDRDGDLDLFQGVNWLRNNGNLNFEKFDTGVNNAYSTTADRAQLADFDRDGDLDAIVGQLSLGSGGEGTGAKTEFAWFEAPADPTQLWIRHDLDTNVNGSLSVFATDFDFDGDQDIIVGEWRGDQRLIAFENDLCGSGEFNKIILDDGALGYEHHDGARVVDIDADGDLDVVSNGWTNDKVLRIYENTTPPVLDDRPIVNAGTDKIISADAVTLTGSATDPDGGEIVSYQWSQESGPNVATLSGANTTELTATNLIDGLYVFRLTVIDEEGDRGFDSVTVTKSTLSTVTRINSGGPNYIYDGVSWATDQYSNGGATLTNAIEIANTENDVLYQTERYRTQGDLIYEIPVTNGEHSLNLHFAEIYYGVPGDGSTGGAGSRVFNIDIEGQQQKENYDIFVEAGGAATAIIETFSGINVADGSLTITLTPVTEFPKISGIEIIEPVVEGAPVVDAGDDQMLTSPENSTVLSGLGSDSDGGTVTFEWTQESGPNLATLSGNTTPELSVSDMEEGVYVFRLTVTDDEGEVVSDDVSVTLVPQNGLLAVAEAAPTEGVSPLEVTFTGSNSVGDITTYLWDFKDGKTSSLSDAANTFVENGTYEVVLTVTDAGGNTHSDTVTITVSETIEGDKMGYILEKNPITEGVANIRILNQPEDFMMLGINLYDQQGRLISGIGAEDVIVSGVDTYQVPVHLLQDGIYFLHIANNKGKPVTMKLLIQQP